MVTPDEWQSRGDFWTWQGHRIFVRIEGRRDGEPLLVVHGFPTASWDYHAIWPALVQRFRVLTLDMIGFGFSAKPRAFPYSIFAQADLYEALLAREGVTSYRLLAHDYGLSVTQELLARQQGAKARMTSACLLNGGLFPETHRPVLTQKLLASPLGPLVARLSSYRTFAATIRGIWGATPPPETELRAMWQLVNHNDGRAVMPKIIGYIAERKQHRDRWVGALVERSATIPIRYVAGLVDPISGAEMVARYRQVMPKPDVVELPNVGHYPQVEVPAAVCEAFFAHTAA